MNRAERVTFQLGLATMLLSVVLTVEPPAYDEWHYGPPQPAPVGPQPEPPEGRSDCGSQEQCK